MTDLENQLRFGREAETKVLWFNFETSKELLEDRQSGVDGGLAFQQFAGTNVRACSELRRTEPMCWARSMRNIPYNRYRVTKKLFHRIRTL